MPSASISISLLLSLCAFLLMLLAQPVEPVLRRHRPRRMTLPEGHHFIVKIALTECRVPDECRAQVEGALLSQTQVPECQSSDYFLLLRCLDNEILSRTNLTDLNSRSGRVCCEVDEVSLPCQLACRSALFAPTLGHGQKKKRIEMVCNRNHGDKIKGDSGVLNCLATTKDWLSPRSTL